MDKQQGYSFQNFDKTVAENSHLQPSKISANIAQTFNSIATGGISPANMLISTMSGIQGAGIIPSVTVANTAYPLHIHLHGPTGNLSSALNLPMQISNPNGSINVPLQFPNVTAGVVPHTLPIADVTANGGQMQLTTGNAINVPLQLQNPSNIQIATPTVNLPMQLHNPVSQAGLHGSIIHLHVPQSQGRKPIIIEDSAETREVTNAVPMPPMNSSETMHLESNVQHMPFPSMPSSQPIQMRTNARTMPPVVYIQTSSGLKPVSGTEVVNNAPANNPPQIIVRRPVTSSASIQFISQQTKTMISSRSGTVSKSTAIPNTQPVIIQKPKQTIVTAVPTRPIYTYLPLATNKKPINGNKAQEQSPMNQSTNESAPEQKVFLSPLNVPKMPSAKFILPMSLPATMSSKGPIINLQISNGQLQNDRQGNITVMCDTGNTETQASQPMSEVKEEPPSGNSYPVSIPGSRVEPTGEREYTLSIPESNSAMGDDMYTVSITEENGNEQYSLITEKEEARKLSAAIAAPAPAILRRSNSDHIEKKIHISNNKRRTSLCTDRERDKVYMYRENNTENYGRKLEICEDSGDEDRVPSLFCDEKFDKDFDCRPAKVSPPEDIEISVSSSRNQYGDHRDRFNKHVVVKRRPSKVAEPARIEQIIKPSVDQPKLECYDFPWNDDFQGLTWSGNVASLSLSKLKFKVNEFHIVDSVDETDEPIDRRNDRAPLLVKKPSALEDFYCCDGCGCHGLSAEFLTPNFCSQTCQSNFKKEQLSKTREAIAVKKMQKKRKPIMMKKECSSGAKSGELSRYDFGEVVTSVADPLYDENAEFHKKYPWMCGESGFSWSRYLEHTKARCASGKLFHGNAFPCNKNEFKVDMRLEAIDPSRPAIFAVVSVRDVQGYRLRLHFDGYDDNYDFWVNADSTDIFPPGWCDKNNRVLQPPHGYTHNSFSWQQYFKHVKGTPAPRHLFQHVTSATGCPNGFRVGMKLEADDRKNNLVCVATVADNLDNRILVRFDSWDDIYDYWVDPTSPYVHPVGWCDENGISLTPPNSCKDTENFTWEQYLSETSSTPVPARAFKTRPAHGFKCGMKLEVVDKRVPFLIRVASVTDTHPYQLKISFDGWPEELSYWVDDDCPDIHPVDWCLKTGHPLEPPLTEEELKTIGICGTRGCKGLGSTLGSFITGHKTADTCPYRSPASSPISPNLPDRLAASRPPPQCTVPRPREPKRGRPPLSATPVIENVTDRRRAAEAKRVRAGSAGRALAAAIEAAVESRGASARRGRAPPPRRPSPAPPDAALGADPRLWAPREVCDFAARVCRRADLSRRFQEELLDGEALLMVSQEELVDALGLRLGPAMKIYDSVLRLRQRILRPSSPE